MKIYKKLENFENIIKVDPKFIEEYTHEAFQDHPD